MDFKWLNEGQVKTNGDKIEILLPHKAIFSLTTAQSEKKESRRNLCATLRFITQRLRAIL